MIHNLFSWSIFLSFSFPLVTCRKGGFWSSNERWVNSNSPQLFGSSSDAMHGFGTDYTWGFMYLIVYSYLITQSWGLQIEYTSRLHPNDICWLRCLVYQRVSQICSCFLFSYSSVLSMIQLLQCSFFLINVGIYAFQPHFFK